MLAVRQTTLHTKTVTSNNEGKQNERAESTSSRTGKHTRRNADNSAKHTHETERKDGHVDERPLHRVQQYIERLEAWCEFVDRVGEEQHGNLAQHGVENLNDDLGLEEPKQHAKVDLRDNIKIQLQPDFTIQTKHLKVLE